MKIEDSLDKQQNISNLNHPNYTLNYKRQMQSLYKQQLDDLVLEKNKQKQVEKNRQIIQRKEFNQRINTSKESQRIKEQAYKNYYIMLLNNQEQLQSSYVNPFSKRDTMKDQFITHSLQEGELKQKNIELQQKQRQFERKNLYRNQLIHQIQQRKKIQTINKQQQQKKNDQSRKYYDQIPDQLTKLQRQKHRQGMAKYKEDLDRARSERQYIKYRGVNDQQNNKSTNEQHNILINPMPYNIQNPYILRQMSKQSYLANRAYQNNFNYFHQ